MLRHPENIFQGAIAQAMATMTQLHDLDLSSGTVSTSHPIAGLPQLDELMLELHEWDEALGTLPLQSTQLTTLCLECRGSWRSVSQGHADLSHLIPKFLI